MAHITKRRDRPKPYLVRFRGPDGKERSKAFLHKSDAERWAAIQTSDLVRGAWVDPKLSREPFEAWAERWFAQRTMLRPKTRAGYRSLLNNHLIPRFGATSLEGIHPSDLASWVAELHGSGLSASWTRQAVRLLGAILKAAVVDGRLARNPAEYVALPRLQIREQAFLTAAQVEELGDAAGSYRLMILVLAYGGLRWGEAAALRRRRCDLLRGRLDIAEAVTMVGGQRHYGSTKSGRSRSVVLPVSVIGALESHLEGISPHPETLVFTSPRGSPLDHSRFTKRVWSKATMAIGFPDLRIHDLRHTAASFLIAEGANIKAVQRQLGHASATVTLDRYGHLYGEDFDRLGEALERRRQSAAYQLRTNQVSASVNPVVHLREHQGAAADS